MKPSTLRSQYQKFKESWWALGFYERFEQLIALAITALIAVIIVIALVDLTKGLLPLLIRGDMNPLDHRAFQAIFGQIMTLLIAMEFKHSIIKVVARKESIIQVKTVLLIALMALSRKFIILDADKYPADKILALALVVLAIGIVYWLVRDRENRVQE